jgi:hypothetical protein
MDQFYELVMIYLVGYAHHVTFPELVYPLILKCKKFVKTCKVQNFVKVVRGLLEKVHENVKLVEERRQKTGLNVKDNKQMVSEYCATFSLVHVSFCRSNGSTRAVSSRLPVRLSCTSNGISRCDNEKFKKILPNRKKSADSLEIDRQRTLLTCRRTRCRKQAETRCPI